MRDVAALLALLGAGSAVAAPQVRLALDAPVGCPDAAWLARRIDTLLGRPGVSPQSQRLAAVTVREAGAGLWARLDLDGGQRTLATPTQDCPALLDATALAVVVVLDPLRGLALPEPPASVQTVAPGAPSPPPTPKPDPEPVSPEPPSQPEPPAAPYLPPGPSPWLVRATGLVALGQTPAPVAFGFNLGVDYRRGVFGVGLEGRWDLPAANPAESGQVAADWLGASALGCVHLLDVLGLCGVMSAAAQTVSGEGYSTNREATVPYLAVGGRGRLDLELTPLVVLHGWGELALPVSRTRLRVGDDQVWESWPVSIAGGAGLGVRL